MEFERPSFRGRAPIDAYGDGGFTVGGARRTGSLLLLQDDIAPWPTAALSAADEASLQPLLDEADRYDFVLLGCGATIAPPPAGLRALLKSAGLGVEFMDTGAACRVYNVLLTEQRRFAGAFIAV